ncbi:hypothetical protein GOP47_0024891 [Adiantum capillus-veneris]|uniref:Uncharacterized protein n=1 Tax=Adiantum capillus-veneris TaxID=13818 RepID=A0A9D4U2M1_ADICA|nr:hypothetical protein GOP47_0024891 [Adiantum capillus-veneris]
MEALYRLDDLKVHLESLLGEPSTCLSLLVDFEVEREKESIIQSLVHAFPLPTSRVLQAY